MNLDPFYPRINALQAQYFAEEARYFAEEPWTLGTSDGTDNRDLTLMDFFALWGFVWVGIQPRGLSGGM